MADVRIRLVADLDSALREVSGFKKEYADLVRVVEKPLRQISAFRDLESALERTQREMNRARDNVRSLGDELARTAAPSRALQASYRDALAELGRLERSERTLRASIASRRGELRDAGVDTKRLAEEQRRLNDELTRRLGAGRADRAMSAAREALGVGQLEREQRALVELRRQYQLISQDATLSGKQRAEAEANYRRSVDQSLGRLRQLRQEMSGPANRPDSSLSSAKNALGLASIKNAQQALVELRRQYQQVRDSGVLSSRELTIATANYQGQVKALLATLREQRTALTQSAAEQRRTADEIVRRQAEARAAVNQLVAEQKKSAIAARQQALEAARGDLGVSRYRALAGQLQQLQLQYQNLRANGNLTSRELGIAQNTLNQRLRETQRELKQVARGYQGLNGLGGNILSGLGNGLGGAPGVANIAGLARGGAAVGAAAAVSAGLVKLASDAVKGSDEISRLDAMLRLATASQEEFNRAQIELDRVADDTQGDVSDLIVLYSRLQRPLAELKMGQEAALETTEAVTLGLKISGASADEAANAVRQLSQAMAFGKLKGQDFNSVISFAPRLANALADSLGVTSGELKELAGNGEITAEVIVKALRDVLPQLRKEYSEFAPEVGAAWDRVWNEQRKALGRMAKESGITDWLAGKLDSYAKNLNSSNNLIRKGQAAVTDSMSAEAARQQEIITRQNDMLRRAKDQRIADLQTEAVQAKAALAQSTKVLQDALKKQAEVRKEFADLVKGITSAPAGDPSVGDVGSATANARNALTAGNTSKAIDEARRGLELLQQLKDAGENSYGFAGMAKELERIANKAAEVEAGNAKAAQQVNELNLADLEKRIKDVENVQVSFGMDFESVDALKAQLDAVAADLAKRMFIPVTVVPGVGAGLPGGGGGAPKLPGFAGGGRINGPGTGTSDSILARLSNGEFVVRAAAVRHYGPDVLDRLNSLRVPRFADGGGVNIPRLLPSIPDVPSALLQQSRSPVMESMGSLTINLGGQDSGFTVYGTNDTLRDIRKAASKFGRTRPK
ncbi:TPA: tape measure protein [Pseudomonas aeruginosa]|uniref:tape measure protein n=1 Tax=Pseudomonas aeruginosa TaxID=287 RepID=UPI0009AC0FA5|nr:tape measure protein [Pseudomonas aeruginosa]KSN78552.2 hypothetical protein APA90_11610 [Pseudomonas aeruginosa]MBG7478046.1 tape measure protein [Pseudomonas aeruginosa]